LALAVRHGCVRPAIEPLPKNTAFLPSEVVAKERQIRFYPHEEAQLDVSARRSGMNRGIGVPTGGNPSQGIENEE
jgi:hypothetical protein